MFHTYDLPNNGHLLTSRHRSNIRVYALINCDNTDTGPHHIHIILPDFHFEDVMTHRQ